MKGDLAALGHGGGGLGHRGVVRADDHVHADLLNQALRLGLADLSVALGIGDAQHQLAAVQPGNARLCGKGEIQLGVLVVDDLRSQLDGQHVQLADGGDIAAQRIEHAHLAVRRQRHDRRSQHHKSQQRG